MRRHELVWGAVLLASCTSSTTQEGASTDAVGGEPSGAGQGSGSSEDPERRAIVPAARESAAALARGLGHEGRVVEVWLDPRASAALSVDTKGGVRLWPNLPTTTSELTKLAPVRVPIREPRTLSLARTSGDAFVIAAIDTSQATRVIEIELDAEGNAGVRERFSLPPNDPLLELHAFDGGERLLGLGVDHRLRLYDGEGQLLSVFSEYGFSPWQLRVSGPAQAPTLAVVLAGPTRLQRIAIEGDVIAKRGAAHPLRLDRGPNLNDLALLPAGNSAAVLRRPKAKSGLWVVELHDLDSGAIRVLWGEASSKRRLRMHVLSDDALLLESHTGEGYRVELAQAVLLPPTPAPTPELPDPQPWTTVETLPPASRVTPTLVNLPVSDDARQVAVVGSLRAGPSASGWNLLFDPLDADRHFTLGTSGFAGGIQIDPTGSRIASHQSEHDDVVITELGDRSEHASTCSVADLRALAFTDADHLVLIGGEKATICAWKTGEVRSEAALPSAEVVAIHVDAAGKGTIGLRETTDEEWRMRAGETEGEPDKRQQLPFTANTFGTLAPLTGKALAGWPELDTDVEDKTIALDRTGNVYVRKRIDTRHFSIDPPQGKQRKLTFAERAVDLIEIEPSPDGKHVALVHSPATDHGPYGYGYGYGDGYGGGVFDARGDVPDLLSLFAIEGDTATLRFAAAIETTSVALSWSEDGSRLAVGDHGRLRVFDPSGEVVFDRHDRALRLEDLPDAPPEPAKTP
jgi:hypothetical protein